MNPLVSYSKCVWRCATALALGGSLVLALGCGNFFGNNGGGGGGGFWVVPPPPHPATTSSRIAPHAKKSLLKEASVMPEPAKF